MVMGNLYFKSLYSPPERCGSLVDVVAVAKLLLQPFDVLSALVDVAQRADELLAHSLLTGVFI